MSWSPDQEIVAFTTGMFEQLAFKDLLHVLYDE
jgi:hypothetical protein